MPPSPRRAVITYCLSVLPIIGQDDRRRPSALFHLAVKDLVGPPHAVIRRDARSRNQRIVPRLSAQIDELRSFFPRRAGLVELLRLRPEVAEVRLPGIELRLALE